jgi:hypothetical protein
MILVTRPKYDDGTEYLSAYAFEVIKKAKSLNINVKDFEGDKANKEEVSKFLSAKNPKLLFLNGHGCESEICGHKDEPLFSLNNISLLKNKIVYARACFAALNLGKNAVKDNDGCFIGYIFPFSFWMDNKWSANPLKDKMSALYLLPSNEIVISLLKKGTAQEANEKSKRMMIENMKKILIMEQKNEPGATDMLQILWNNYEGQVVLGNKEAKI